MNYVTIIKTISVGFFIGAIVGPIAILCMRRTIKEGFLVGLAAGFGVAIADGMYSALALYGVAALQTILTTYWLYLQLILSTYLIYLGVDIITSDTKATQQAMPQSGLFKATISTFLLTLANPTTIIAFFTIFSSMNIIAQTKLDILVGACCIMIGSAAWWTIMAALGHTLRTNLTRTILTKINIISGCCIMLFGIVMLLDALLLVAHTYF